MKKEIERKFLVVGEAWRTSAEEGVSCRQGYLSGDHTTVTVRVRQMGGQGFLTLKGPTAGISRTELEYAIPVEDAEYMLENFCAGRIVSKTRYILECSGSRWEIDEFSGENRGLTLAEIELESEDQPFEKPDWLGKEVSSDARYFNAVLAGHPFSGRDNGEKV